MFDTAECLFLYAESSLRVGSDEERPEVDLPVQRAATGYPLVPSSSFKGVLRARAGRSKRLGVPVPARLRTGERRRPPSSVVVSDALALSSRSAPWPACSPG